MSVSTTGEQKAHENLLRRKAGRQGLRLEKSRRKDPDATGYGMWRIIDLATGEAATIAGRQGKYDLTLAQVEAWLRHEEPGDDGGHFTNEAISRSAELARRVRATLTRLDGSDALLRAAAHLTGDDA